MASTSPAIGLQPQFSLAALLLVLAGLALVGNTIVGGLPDKLIALAKKGSGSGSSGDVLGPPSGLGSPASGTTPGAKIGAGTLGNTGGPTQTNTPGAGTLTGFTNAPSTKIPGLLGGIGGLDVSPPAVV